jgi:hypothetical protein
MHRHICSAEKLSSYTRDKLRVQSLAKALLQYAEVMGMSPIVLRMRWRQRTQGEATIGGGDGHVGHIAKTNSAEQRRGCGDRLDDIAAGMAGVPTEIVAKELEKESLEAGARDSAEVDDGIVMRRSDAGRRQGRRGGGSVDGVDGGGTGWGAGSGCGLSHGEVNSARE